MNVVLTDCNARHAAARTDGVLAIRHLTLQIQSGEQVAIIGPSGAGKTTLLHVLACAIQPQSGQLEIDGQAVWHVGSRQRSALRKQLFLAPQVPPLPPRQRVVTSVLAGQLPHHGLWHSLCSLFYPTRSGDAHLALAQFDLEDKLFDRVDRLSGGERQRVGLSRCLVSGAQLLLVDEPLSALDPTRAEQAMLTLTGHADRSKSTLVCTLHQVDMALRHFPRIVGLRDGEMVFDLPSKDVSEDRLRNLYAHHLEELNGPAPDPAPYPATPAPVVMHCR